GQRKFAATEASYMIAFLEAVKVKYGGMDMSVMNVTGLSKADVEILQTVLRGEI
ncbi:hypothetical protein V8F44DRAFT_483634, partial [Aspergillus fumigatus]